MKRIMVNLDEKPGELLEARAAEQKRSVSSYVALLVEQDLREAGLISDDSAEDDDKFWAKAKAAARKDKTLKSRIADMIPQSTRRRLVPA
jgi:hypothetical protein